MIKDIQELNFPGYATMCAATCPQPDMGEWCITSQIRIDGQIAPDFSYDWEVLFQGHKYIQPLRKPQGSKDNERFASVISLTFQHWAIYQLKRWPFVTMQPIDSVTAVADEEVADVSLNLKDFCGLFKQVLAYYYGDKITLSLNPEWQYKEEAEVISISHTKVWNVLVQVFYEKFGVRWDIKPNGSPDKYVIRIGYPTTEQSHIFEYGFEGGLMKVERQTQSEEITNMLKGRGGEKNLPFRYFKALDPQNTDFAPDPDWIEELASIYFSRLMPATFRSYVQGWKAAHVSKYPGYTPKGEKNAYSPWAYRKGFTDTKFHPVEFVADEIVAPESTGGWETAHPYRQMEILPGYSPFVKKGSSLDKYGPLLNSLDDNDEIFPTIQGVTVNPYGRIDQTVAVEPITSDDIADAAESDAQISTFEAPWPEKTEKVAKNSRKTIELTGTWFSVPAGKHANFDEGNKVVKITKDGLRIWYDFKTGKWNIGVGQVAAGYENVVIEETSVVLESAAGGIVSASGIPAGTYRYKVTCKVHNTASEDYNVTVSLESPTLTDATIDDKWSNVWHIWVKNIWQSSKLLNETDKQYAERVWRPILGDREGNEAKVLFTSGALAVSDDYEFTIVSTPEYDTSKTLDGVQSHWKITLAKSDADLESLGVYLPSTMRQAIAGDYFVFLGIDPQHYYTDWAERRLDDWKKDNLRDKSDIKPTWVVQTDRVRLNGYGKEDALIRQLHPGDTLRLADKRFIEGDYETLYLSSLTYTYREPTKEDAALNPDVEIVLSDRYEVSANIVSTLQGEVSALAKQVGSISNIEQIVRMVGDKLYLRKDGLPDRSLSPTEFASLLTSLGFRSGMVGGAGWGIYKDSNGNWVIEADRFMARQDLEVNNLVINQVTGQGGTVVESAAQMEITRVEELDNGYKCYFDQHEGTVANLFHVDDVAWNNRYTPENDPLKFYRRRVTEVGADYVVLSDTDVNGTGVPAEGDVIVHHGNYTDKQRQYIKVRDVVGGGYERYIEGLDSVDAEGEEYYFVGRQIGDTPRWFIGNRDKEAGSGKSDGSFIEYKDKEFNLHNVALSVGSRIGDTKLGDLIESFDATKYLRKALNQSTKVINGLVLTSAILLGTTNAAGERETWAGHSGLYNNPKSIASFWGGPMVDRFYDEDGNTLSSPSVSGYAASLVRMDGSAYFAKGNIGFEADGSGWLGNHDNGIRFDALGTMTFGSGIKVALNGSDKSLKETLESLLNFNAGLTGLLTPCDANGNPIPWADATKSDGAGGIRAKSLKANVGLWSESFVSARGRNPWQDSGPVGASALKDLNDVALSNPASGQALVYNGTKWVNQTINTGLNTTELANYLTTNDYAKKSDIPSLSDYAKKSDIPSLTGYATETWVNNKGYITASALSPYLKSADAATVYLTKTDAASVYLAKSTAASTYLTQAAFNTFAASYDAWKDTIDDFKALFDLMFEKDGTGTDWNIKALRGLWTNSFVSARGKNADGGTGPGTPYDRLDAWGDYSTDKAGYVLSAKLGYDLHANKLSKTEAASTYLTKTDAAATYQPKGNYLTSHQSLAAYLKSAVAADTYLSKTDAATLYQPVGDYLTEHQDIYRLTFASGTFSAKTYTPNSGAATVYIPTTTSHITEGTRLYFTEARAQSALSGHTGDTTVHITAAERTAWNAKLDKSVYDTFKAGYDTWKSTVDAFISEFNLYFELQGTTDATRKIKALFGLYSDSFISARGLNSAGGGGGNFGLMKDWPSSAPDKNGTDALSAYLGWGLKQAIADVNTRIDNLPTTSVNPYALTIQKNGTTVKTYDGSSAVTANITIGWADTASGRPSWIGASKPSYAFSELSSHPTTLAGYGITDAVAAIDGKDLSSNDFTDALLTKLNGIEDGANKYVHPTNGANTTISAANGRVLSAITVNAQGHVTSVSSKTLAAADIPTLAISKITGLQAALDSKLNASVFNDFMTLFNEYLELEEVNGVKRIKAKHGFYSVDFVSAKGLNSDAAAGSAFGLMRSWPATAPANTTTDALGANLGWGLKTDIDGLKGRVTALEGKNYLDALAISTTGSGNAVTSVSQSADKKTLTFTKGSTFLTAHQTLHTLTIQKNGTQAGTFKPNADATINLTDVASAATLSAHTGNGTVHITAAERTKWNTASSNLDTILGSDASGVIDKWDEIVAFLDTYTEADTLANLLGNKADKSVQVIAGTGLTGGGTLAADRTLSLAASGVTAGTYFKTTVDKYGRVTAGSNPTTLGGFGITNAYTKTEADDRYVNVTGDTMTGALTLPRLNIAGSASSSAYLTADSATNVYFNVGGRTQLVIDNASAVVRPGSSYNNVFSFGASSYRWANIYSVLGNFSGLITASAGIKIGDVTITYDSAQKGLKISGGGLYSETYISARGANSAGGSGTSFGRLDDWSNYNAKGTDALSATLGKGLLDRIVSLEGKNYLNDLAVVVSGSGNAVTAVTQSADRKTLTFTKGTTFLTSHQSLANYVTLNTAQTISGVKTFSNGFKLNTATSWTSGDRVIPFSQYDDMSVIRYYSDDGGKGLTFNPVTGALKAGSFVMRGGTSAQFLKADGSVDSTAYLASSSYTASNVLAKLLTVDGTGSGLDADLLDGVHNGDLTAKYLVAINDGTTDLNTLGAKSDKITYYYAGGGSTNANRPTTANPFGVFNLRVADGYMAQLAIQYDRPYTRYYNSSTWGAWNKIAFTTDNVASATKLQTARTIWGQSFNGTANVTGVLSLGSSYAEATGSGSRKTQYTGNGVKLIHDNSSAFGMTAYASDGTTSLGTVAASYAVNDALKWFFYGGSYTDPAIAVLPNKNVGIGTTDPGYKLHVVGSVRATTQVITPLVTNTAILTLNGTSGIYLKYNNDDTKALFLKDTAFKPWDAANNKLSLGTSSARWSNVYSVLGNFSGLLTVASSMKIGDCTVTWVAGKGLHFDRGIYSDGHVSARGANADGGSEGGLIQTVYGSKDLGKTFSDTTLTDTFNAFTINKIWTEKADKTALGSYYTKGETDTRLTNGTVTKVGTATKGSASLPVYINAGTPTACTASSLFSSLTTSNNAISMTVAGQTRTLTVPFATKSSYVASTSPIPATGQVLAYFSGQPTIGTDSGNAFKGSSATHTLWSFPDGGTSVSSGNVANVQVLRFSWGTTYFHEIFTSPNYNDVWHRSVISGTAKDWERFITTGNYTDHIKKIGTATVGSATRPVYLSGGTVTAGTYTFGNGSGNAPVSNGTVNTNLNADMLDGYHRNNLFNGTSAWMGGTTDLSQSIEVAGDANTYYPVIITVSDDKKLPTTVSVWKNLGSKTPSSYSGNHTNGTSSMWLLYRGRRSSWDGNGGHYQTLYRSMPYANLCAKTENNANVHGGLIVWLRGGGCQYYVSCTNAFTVTVSLTEHTLGTSGSTSYKVEPTTTLGNLGQLNTGFVLYGKATSASKLADNTAFKAWGQTFFENGVPKTVSGSLSSVGNITGSGAMTVSSTNGRLTLNGAATGLDLKFGNTDSKSVILNGTAFKPFDAATNNLTLGSASAVWSNVYSRNYTSDTTAYLSSGTATTSVIFRIGTTEVARLLQPNGYLGLGTTAPAYRLDVNGAVRANSGVIGNTADAFRAVNKSYGFIIRNDNSGTYFLLTAKDDAYGSYNALRPLRIDNATGRVQIGNGLTVNELKIGDCTVTWVAGKGLHFDKGIYSDDFVSARGANADGGSEGGLIQTVYGSKDLGKTFSDTTLTDTFNAFAINKIHDRVASLEGGSALSVATTGTGNAVTAISKSGTAITATKGATFLKTDGSNGTQAGASALIRKLTEASGDVADTTMFVTSHNAPSDTNSLFYRRPATKLWNYIKGKGDAEYQAKGSYVTTDTAQTISGKKSFSYSIGVAQTDGRGIGISLYNGTENSQTYGLFFGKTDTHGTHGSVTGDWATYLTMNGAATRGWVFRHKASDGTYSNVGSVSGSGVATMSRYRGAAVSSSWYDGRDHALLRNTGVPDDQDIYAPLWSAKTRAGSWECGTYTSNSLRFSYITDVDHDAKSNTATSQIILSSTGALTAAKFIRSGGTSAQFLKADGSVDATAYLSVSAAASTYVKKEGDTMTGALTVPTLTISNTEGKAHVAFSRAGYNYLTAPASGFFCFVADGKAVGDANSDLQIKANEILPGTTNLVTMGTSSRRWSNMYSVNANVSSAVKTPQVYSQTILKLVGVSEVQLKFNNTDERSVVLNSTAFKPFAAADGAIELGTDAARWKKVTACSMRLSSSTSGQGGDTYLELWRGTNASWRILNTSGDLKIQSNYTDKAGDYFSCMTLSYNTGNVSVLGHLLPVNGRTKNLGSAEKRWNEAYCQWAYVCTADKVDKSALASATKIGGGYFDLHHATPYIDFYFGNSATYTSRIIAEASGRLKVTGTLRVVTGMYSDGYVSARGQNTSSDARLKRGLTPFEIELGKIAEAPSVGFEWLDGSRDVGSVAQYWRGVCPLLTPEGPDGYLTLQYGKTALLASITIARRVMSHEERIARLERENEELKRKIEVLESGRVQGG